MEDYVGKNQCILDEWRAKFIENKQLDEEYDGWNLDELFAEDGIMNKGEFYQEKGIWKRKFSGKNVENESWSKAPLRILFLSKDENLYDYSIPAWDVRTETFYLKDTERRDTISDSYFYQNEACALYGLLHTDLVHGMMLYDNITWEDALHFSDDQIFARVNCKKEGGGLNCTNSMLNKAVREYFDYLSRQLKLLDADIIVCTGKNSVIHKLNEVYEGKFKRVPEAPEAWYNEEENKLAIDCYHLSWPYASVGDEVYNSILQPYFAFLQMHPDFVKHR